MPMLPSESKGIQNSGAISLPTCLSMSLNGLIILATFQFINWCLTCPPPNGIIQLYFKFYIESWLIKTVKKQVQMCRSITSRGSWQRNAHWGCLFHNLVCIMIFYYFLVFVYHDCGLGFLVHTMYSLISMGSTWPYGLLVTVIMFSLRFMRDCEILVMDDSTHPHLLFYSFYEL